MGRAFRSLFFVLTAVACGPFLAAASASGAPGASIVRVGGYPELQIGGHPFFVGGAAFFYERIPHDEWRADMLALRELGINTLDIYVIWNWHELADGNFDFDGHTNPRRDLRGLLQMARDLGFAVIVRPGPVIRNEWRNGGYPAWLLERPEYGMPLHDLLEGRYPPTATLQNAHSDDAAAEWMRNATHMRYARRWLERAMQVVAESGVTVVGVALDDDQGAYIDNQTWPAPHLAAYLAWLKGIVSRFTSAPAFINTYEMKVTASAPVWALGDWYQSEAYSIGEHDRSQLEFSTGLLQTQNDGPVMLGEFQAGWLEQPGDVLPRPADPTNTLLATHTLLGVGLHGLVNFPAQDTIYPAGWEAPFANAFYAWDAALAVDRVPQPRAVPTRRFGGIVRAFGPLLAGTHVAADAGIAYMTSAYDPRLVGGETVGAIASKTMQAQGACRAASMSCDLVDLRFAPEAALRRYPIVFVPLPSPDLGIARATEHVHSTLKRYVQTGGVLVTFGGDLSRGMIERALTRAHRTRNVQGFAGATLLRSDDGSSTSFLVAANYHAASDMRLSGVTVAAGAGGRLRLPDLRLAPRDAIVVPIDVPLRAFSAAFAEGDRLASSTCPFTGVDGTDHGAAFHIASPRTPCTAEFLIRGKQLTASVTSAALLLVEPAGAANVQPELTPTPAPSATPQTTDSIPVRNGVSVSFPQIEGVPKDQVSVYQTDIYRDGYAPVIMQNDLVRLVISPNAGGRAFVFEDLATGRSCFTTVGALRDDVTIQPPASRTDRIAKYTHQFPAGTFNREYAVNRLAVSESAAEVRLSYDAPDVVPHGAHFERFFTLASDSRSFSVDEAVTFVGPEAPAKMQRAVSITSLAVGNPRDMSTQVTLTPEARVFAAGAALKVASHALGFYDQKSGELAIIAWRTGGVEDATVDDRPDSVVARLTLARGHVAHMVYSYERADSLAAAQRRIVEADRSAQAP